MADHFETYNSGLDDPATIIVTITPNDNTNLPVIPRALHVSGDGGLVNVIAKDDYTNTPVTVYIAQGAVMPIRVKRVLSTGTTATDIRGLW